MTSSIGPLQVFALLKQAGSPNTVRRISITSQAQDQLGQMVASQLQYFTSPDLERVSFDPTFKTDEEHVLWISGFELPDHIQDAIDTPEEVPAFSSEETFRSVKAIFLIDADGHVFLQCWRRVDALNRQKLWLLLSKKTFDVMDEPPLVLERKLDAVYWDGDLLFRSYANTSSMLELLEYVAEATAEDFQDFVDNELFSGDAAALSSKCSKLHKRHIRLLVQSGVLGNQTAEELCERAMEVNYELPFDNGQIAIPNGGKELSDLLHFLRDRIYRGPVTGQTYLANSARVRPPD